MNLIEKSCFCLGFPEFYRCTLYIKLRSHKINSVQLQKYIVHHKMEAHVLKTTLLLVFSITSKVFGDGETDYRLIFPLETEKLSFCLFLRHLWKAYSDGN